MNSRFVSEILSLCRVYRVERVELVLVVDVYLCVAVFQHKDSPARSVLICAYHCVKSERSSVKFAVLFDVFEQVKAKFVQSQVHYGNAGLHLFYVHYFVLQLFKLGFAVKSSVDLNEDSSIDSFLSGEQISLAANTIDGLDDFELVCFVTIK